MAAKKKSTPGKARAAKRSKAPAKIGRPKRTVARKPAAAKRFAAKPAVKDVDARIVGGLHALLPKNTEEHRIEYDREEDGRWIADIPSLPGVLVYGETKREASRNARALALEVLADRLRHNETKFEAVSFVDA